MDFPAFAEHRIGIANIAPHFARVGRSRSQFVLVRVRVVGFVWSVIPRDVQLLAALKRSPPVIRNYRDAAERLKRRWRLEWINRNNLTHARDLLRSLVVGRLHFPAENRL